MTHRFDILYPRKAGICGNDLQVESFLATPVDSKTKGNLQGIMADLNHERKNALVEQGVEEYKKLSLAIVRKAFLRKIKEADKSQAQEIVDFMQEEVEVYVTLERQEPVSVGRIGELTSQDPDIQKACDSINAFVHRVLKEIKPKKGTNLASQKVIPDEMKEVSKIKNYLSSCSNEELQRVCKELFYGLRVNNGVNTPGTTQLTIRTDEGDKKYRESIRLFIRTIFGTTTSPNVFDDFFLFFRGEGEGFSHSSLNRISSQLNQSGFAKNIVPGAFE